MNKDFIPTLSIAGWDIGTVPAHGTIIFRPHSLAHSMQKIEESLKDRTYEFQATQARELALKILELLKRMENAPAPKNQDQKH